MVGVGSLWFALERVWKVGLVVAVGSLGQGGAGLVVWNVTLSRVGEQGKDGGDLSCRSGLAGGDGDEELH